MSDDFTQLKGFPAAPAYFPTDTGGKIVPVYNHVGRFTGQFQKNGRIAVDVAEQDTEPLERLLQAILIELSILNRNTVLVADKLGASPVESL